jgi:hypothetical protein
VTTATPPPKTAQLTKKEKRKRNSVTTATPPPKTAKLTKKEKRKRNSETTATPRTPTPTYLICNSNKQDILYNKQDIGTLAATAMAGSLRRQMFFQSCKYIINIYNKHNNLGGDAHGRLLEEADVLPVVEVVELVEPL